MTLQDSIEMLTREHKKSVLIDGGWEVHTRDGLMRQLRGAIFGGMEGTGGGSAFGAKEPISPAALDLYTLIDRQISEAWSDANGQKIPGVDKPESLAAQWAALVDEDRIVTVTHPEQHEVDGRRFVVHARAEYQAWQLALKWVEQIETFFGTVQDVPIKEACPSCGERYVMRSKDGEQVRSDVLAFVRDKQTGETLRAVCAVCPATWATPTELEYLKTALGLDDIVIEDEAAEREPTVIVSEACETGEHSKCETFGCRCEHHDTTTPREPQEISRRAAYGQRHTLMAESSAPLNPITREVCGDCFTERSITGDCLCYR